MNTILKSEEITRRGKALYEANIRAQIEPHRNGEFLVLNVDSGEYEIHADDVEVAQRARARFGQVAPLFSLRIGSLTAYRLGGQRIAPFAIK